MNILSETKIYLSGPIESSNDPNSWRNDLGARLIDEFGAIVWDPLKKPKDVEDIDGKKQIQMRKTLENKPKQYDKFIKWLDNVEKIKKQNSQIRQSCLKMSKSCDIMIVNLQNKDTVGTYEEIIMAKGKPVFVITSGIDKINSMWIVDQLDAYCCIDFVFHRTINSLMDLLHRINNNKSSPQWRWYFNGNEEI